MDKKKFDQALCDRYDVPTKQLVSKLLIATGRYVLTVPLIDQTEAFKNHDFIINYIGEGRDDKVLVEVEHKKVWQENWRWPPWYTSLDVPARKDESRAQLFFMSNYHMNMLAFVRMEDVLGSATYRKDTIYTKNEEFFRVHLDLCTFLKIEDDKVLKVSQDGRILKYYDWKVK